MDLTPIFRIEHFYDAIINGTAPPEPVHRVEYFLAKIAGADVTPPAPIYRVEKFLDAIIKGTTPPDPVFRSEFWLAKKAGLDVETPEPVYRVEYWLEEWVGSTPSQTLTVTGVSPLALVNAIAHSIVSLTQTGKCAQASTPAPSSPVDIKCNNGALRMVDDELPSGYKRVLGFECDNNAMWQIIGFKLRGSDTVKVSFSINAACNVWGCYQSTSATDNYDLYATVTAGGKYLRYGNGTFLSAFTGDNIGKRFDVTYTPTGSQGMPEDSTWTEASFESANDLLIGSTTVGGTSSKLKGNLYGDFIVLNGNTERLHAVPCERVSDNVLGYYDLVGETFYEPYTGFAGAVSLGYDGSHYTLDVVGTAEVITVTHADSTTETASAVDLFAVPNYGDTQEIISGAVGRKILVHVFDGTESFSKSTTYGTAYYVQSSVVTGTWGADRACTPVCSHFEGVAPSSSAQTDGRCFFNASGHFYFRTDDYADAAAFKAFVKEQYDAGTPIIVLLKLKDDNYYAESAAAQPLHTTAGTNTVSVTAEVGGIALEAKYKGAA